MKRPILIKAGGELLAAPETRARLVRGLKKLAKEGVVFVHGGGPQIEAELTKNGIPVRFVQGRRVTTPTAMVLVERILSGEINKGFTGQLVAAGVPAVGLSCRDGGLITGRPVPALERAAEPARTKAALLQSLLKQRFVPVVSSVASDGKGNAVNINADDAAAALAVALRAARLVLLTNTAGVLDERKKRIPVLRIGEIDRLIKSGTISGGMIPKVQSARKAIRSGVGEVDILDGKKGIDFDSGTRIVRA